jgi:hypothetical protein
MIRHDKLSREEKVEGIIDIKLRDIGRLNDKVEILNECQSWMKDKVLYYMNLLDGAELKYYVQIKDLTNKLSVKETAIQQQIKIIGDYEKSLEKLAKSITTLEEDNHTIKNTLKREFELKDEDMKKYVSVSRLENLNRELTYQVEVLRKENAQLAG